jgi:ornithine decarboxylase
MDNIKQLAEQHGTPIILFSENEFKRVYQSMQSYLPRVKHHYALKPLPTKECIKIISECDGYMDIASIGELELVKSADPNMVARTVYTHPIKKEADIIKAAQNGIRTMVAENFTELRKIMKVAPEVNVLLRIAFPNVIYLKGMELMKNDLRNYMLLLIKLGQRSLVVLFT